jgi:hypothetical protein
VVRAGDHTRPGRLALLTAHRDRVLARMADLQEDLDVRNYKIGLYDRKEA